MMTGCTVHSSTRLDLVETGFWEGPKNIKEYICIGNNTTLLQTIYTTFDVANDTILVRIFH